MNSSDFSIEQRLLRFSHLISETVCTDGNARIQPLDATLQKVAHRIAATRKEDGSIYLLGNGGSAAIVSHVQTDLVNAAGLRAFTLHEPALLSCMSNDRGYPAAFAETLMRMRPGPADVLIVVSSSGKSPNLLAAAQAMLDQGGHLITLTGFDTDNPLRCLGHDNLWVSASDYGLVECAHQFLLHNITDRLWAAATS